MKILMADDHAVVRQGYLSLLGALIKDVEVIEAGSGTDAVLLFIQQQPDVVVLDINMPDMSGIDACRQIRNRDPDARVLMFSMYEEPGMIREALAAGASGYLSKASSPDLMVEALSRVAAGESFIDPAVSRSVERLTPRGGAGAAGVGITGAGIAGVGIAADSVAVLQGLPAREREIADRLLEGKSNQIIAEELGISAKTVANRATVIRQKFGVTSTAEMVRKVLQN